MSIDKPLRIAVVTETWPPEVNGVATTIARVVQGLHARGHTLELLRPRRDSDDTATHDDGFAEALMPGLPIPHYPQLRMGLPATRRLLRQWTLKRPDVVHVATEGPLGWSALRAARHLGLPLTSDFRTNFQAYSAHYRLGWLRRPIVGYLRHFHNGTGCTMVPTEALRRELQAQGFQRLRVVARGVDTALFDPARRSGALRRAWGLESGGRAVLCVGRLAPEKNLDTVLEAFAAMRAVDPALTLVFIGDGPLRDSLRQRCPDAVFAGQRRDVDLATHYASGDLFLFASLTETFGNVTPEAMASGLALVAFDHAAASQLVHDGGNGLLAPHGDRKAFVRQAQRLAADAARSRAMGVAARRTALGLGWDRIVGQVETAMRSLLTSPEAAALCLESAAWTSTRKSTPAA